MSVVAFLLYLALAYLAYFYSQKYNANAYLWLALGFILPYLGFIICFLHFRKKQVINNKPNMVPPGFRSKTLWKMITASIAYILIITISAAAIIGGSSSSQGSQGSKTSDGNKISASGELTPTATPTPSSQTTNTDGTTVQPTNNTTSANGQLKIHYINVGQADSILIQQDGKNMLIDAGNNADANTVVNYLKQEGVSKLDYFVMTHPHEDHIGGADAVINSFNIGTVYMPKATSTTQTFKDVVTALNSKGLKATAPTPGNTFKLGNATCTVYAPNSENYEDLNNYSIVVKLVYGSNKFLFEGDAEDISEREILNKDFDVSAVVIKIGHHGSSSSSTQAYLSKVNPKYAVISVGKGNDYGHPTAQTMDRLKAMGIKVYRTDENGTVICTSDGQNISFNCNPGSYSAASGGSSSTGTTPTPTVKPTGTPTPTPTVKPTTTPPPSSNGDRIVYYTPGGGSYHYSKSCPTLARSKTILEGKLSDVIKLGKSDPCDKCVH